MALGAQRGVKSAQLRRCSGAGDDEPPFSFRGIEIQGEMSLAQRHLKDAPPIFFACAKENGPCTVQKKALKAPTVCVGASLRGLGKETAQKILVSALGASRAGAGHKRLPREPELRERAKPELSCFYFRAFHFVKRCRVRTLGWGIQRGNRRSAAGGGKSEPVSRKRHDWRPQSGRESQCRNGVRGRSPSPLCRFKGVWGEIEIPPRFWRGMGRGLCAKDLSPYACRWRWLNNGHIVYGQKGT